MAKKLIDFLREQATKAGIAIDSAVLTPFFANDSLSTLELPDELTQPIESNFISIRDAKNNHPEIKALYTKQALDTVDKKILALIDEYGLTEDEKNIVLAEQSSFAKPALLLQIVQKKEQAKASEGKPALQSLQKQIDDLNTALRLEKDKIPVLENSFKQKEKDLSIRYDVDGMLSSYKTINDHLDPRVRAKIIHGLLEDDLQKLGATFDRDETGQLVLKKVADGSNVFGEGNTQILPKNFIEKTLSANKLLVTNASGQNGAGANGANNSQQNGQNGAAAPGGGNGDNKGANSTFRNLMQDAIQTASQPNPVFGSSGN